MAVARFDTLRSIAAGSTGGTYTAVGTPLDHNWRIFRITNATDGDMLISIDGVNDNFFVPASSFVLYDLSSNEPAIADNSDLLMQLGSQWYVKQSSAPTSGSLYIEGIYARGE